MNELKEGIYIQEGIHRFMCEIHIDGKVEKCYVPSSCKLEKLISLTGETVLVTPVKKKNSELRYSLYAVKKRRSWILLNLSEANAVVGESLHKKCFRFLGSHKNMVYEKKIENYKSDIFLPEENLVVEIKTVLTEDEQGVFPGVTLARAKKQLEAIVELLDKGYKACLLLIALNPKTKRITISKELKASTQLAIDKGMICKGFAIRFRNQTPTVGNEIEVVI